MIEEGLVLTEARAGACDSPLHKNDICALCAEVRRLRAEVDETRQVALAILGNLELKWKVRADEIRRFNSHRYPWLTAAEVEGACAEEKRDA